ncbi:hypothetical protein [Lactococcus garvieae]|uniref:Uncharacterized protein n=1 Tax=Lactococcus garvieae TaxID=1363 RepID=A0A1I4HDD2_9LACT|nr:hypothetical protein [Lactococcus garvieae]SFL39740.1 hypothetical protein SAMN05216438_10824 [Lactococcus garvieae]
MKIDNIQEHLQNGGAPIVEEYKGYKICALPHPKTIKPNFFRELSEGNIFQQGKANGYIEIPEWEGKDYEEIPTGNIHGGWTFSDSYLFGFDTLHSHSKSYMDEQWVLKHLKEYIDEVLA